MTREEAQKLINSYCHDIVPNEETAIERLMEHDLAEFDGKTGEAETQNRLDDIIYQKRKIMSYYTLTPAGIAAVQKWAMQFYWNPDAVVDEIASVIESRSEGESLEVEMRGPNYKGWNNGLVFYRPEPDHVELTEETE